MRAAGERKPAIVVALYWFASITGILGAGILALNTSWSGWGFAVLMLSSTSWTAVGLRERSGPLLAMNLAYTCTNLIGIWRWLL